MQVHAQIHEQAHVTLHFCACVPNTHLARNPTQISYLTLRSYVFVPHGNTNKLNWVISLIYSQWDIWKTMGDSLCLYPLKHLPTQRFPRSMSAEPLLSKDECVGMRTLC